MGTPRKAFVSALALGLSGCAPSLKPELTQIEIPARCPERLLFLPLEDRNTPPEGSGDIYREAPMVVRDLISSQLSQQGMMAIPNRISDSLALRHRETIGDLWTREDAANAARDLGERYVLFGTLRGYYRGTVLGPSTRLAWEIELMDAWTHHPLAHVSLDVRGAQSDPFALAQETAAEAARALLGAWDSCPSPQAN